MKEAYRVIYHVLLFVVVKIDYFSIDFHFYDILQVLFFWYQIGILCECFFNHYAESTQNEIFASLRPTSASLVNFRILLLLMKFFRTFLP